MKKRSILIAGCETSVTMEDEFWFSLKEIAKSRRMTLNALLSEIDRGRDFAAKSFSSAIREYVLLYYKNRGMVTRNDVLIS